MKQSLALLALINNKQIYSINWCRPNGS